MLLKTITIVFVITVLLSYEFYDVENEQPNCCNENWPEFDTRNLRKIF